jgi:hypothetical protein
MSENEGNDSGSGAKGKSELASTPLAQDMPLKIVGTDIAHVVLVPKGYTGAFPTIEKAESRISELEVELKTAKDELASRDEVEKKGIITEIEEMDTKLEYKREEELDKLSLNELKPIKKLMTSTVKLVDKHSLTSPPGKDGDEVQRRGLDGEGGE